MKAKKKAAPKAPIEYWSHSSLMAFLRNPLAWRKRYVEKIYDQPRNPSAVVGSAGHKALEHFYGGAPRDVAVSLGLEYLAAIPDFEINFGAASSKKAQKARREQMAADYLQAIGFYLAKPPRHKVVGVEVRATAAVPGFALPLKAVSDLIVESRAEKGAVDVVDHKFVDAFSKAGAAKTLFVMQALFNYYTARELTGRPVRRFLVYECKKRANKDGAPQLRRYALDYAALGPEFELFRRLVNDATAEAARERLWLPNPSDLFEGEHSFDLYRMGLVG
ncbi:MAG: PD-(D/E)XK nuclease family protein [Patescibacteria group bacterium]|nr:PD-(D/E)XK nuclease family protein [Patescibacteria group bacterium]MDE1944497.1 PD-(D/E)XK nuclease family protein [Patescibacteria group bacterium]MDE1945398.1 PD-(D/E)XK nuclease family protein [Patescibacteria group bacterium]MDE2057763.1 PD-(D/E)XK nuclease family protein [Patescibacteria group bacterium]